MRTLQGCGPRGVAAPAHHMRWPGGAASCLRQRGAATTVPRRAPILGRGADHKRWGGCQPWERGHRPLEMGRREDLQAPAMEGA
jgi:hypothetical protein